jgi:hypothetical protein
VHRERLGRPALKRFEHLDADRQVRVGVVVDLDRPDVGLLLLPVDAIDVVLQAFVQVDRFLV